MSLFSKDTDLFKAEEVIYKRDFTQAERRKLAKEGKALPNESYPIATAADLHPAAVLARSGHGDVEAAKALIKRRAKELGVADPLEDEEEVKKGEDFSLVVPLRKSQREGKAYGVVLEPELPDSQGDIANAVEIEKACHEFMRDYQRHREVHAPGIQHSGAPAGAELLENYIAPSDTTLEGEPLTKGSWVQVWQVHDPATRREIDEGRLTGLSLEGSGFRNVEV